MFDAEREEFIHDDFAFLFGLYAYFTAEGRMIFPLTCGEVLEYLYLDFADFFVELELLSNCYMHFSCV